MEPNLASPPAEAVELSVIVPCLNEELNIPELTARLLRTFEVGGFVGEVVLVDDGSRDGTAAAIRALVASHPGGPGSRVTGVFHPTNLGIAEGWKSGVRAASGKLVATIDADLQYQPEDLLRLRRALYEHTVDVVQGWRSAVARAKDQRYTAQPRAQRAAQRRVLHVLAGQQERLRHVRARGLRGPLHLPGELLLLAVVRDGGGARQGLLVPAGRDPVRRAPPGRLVPRGRQRLQGLGQVARRPRHRRRRVPRLGRPARPGHPVSPPAPGRRSVAPAQPLVARALRRLHGGVQPDPLDDHARRRALLRDPAQDPVARRRPRPASSRTRSCAAWCATPTATSPTTAARCRRRSSAPKTSAARPTSSSCRFSPRPTSASTSTSTSCRRTTTRRRSSRSRPADRPASPSSATPTAPSSRRAGRPRCALKSGRATASATPRSASGTRPWA